MDDRTKITSHNEREIYLVATALSYYLQTEINTYIHYRLGVEGPKVSEQEIEQHLLNMMRVYHEAADASAKKILNMGQTIHTIDPKEFINLLQYEYEKRIPKEPK